MLDRAGGWKGYRRYIHQQVTRGDSPEGYERIGSRVALGSQEFLAKVKPWVGRVTKEQPARAQVLKRVTPAEVVSVVEQRRGEPWAEFSNRYGDWGRELALYLARRRSGLTLRQIGEYFGIAEYKTVAAAVTRFEVSLAKDAARVRRVKRGLREMSKTET